jgi:hypothetical protein
MDQLHQSSSFTGGGLMKWFFLIFIPVIVWNAQADVFEVRSETLDKGTWQKQLIYFPTNIESMGARPLVIISHGNGHDYRYYTYLQKHLASHGYIVMSHTNETGPGIETASTTTLVNTDTFLKHLDEIAGGILVGKVDSHKMAWIGHSRGGEGVVRAYTRLKTGAFTPERYSISDIQLISSIEPTTFFTSVQVNPYDVNYHMFVGGADGDVNGSPRRVVMSMPIYEMGVGEKSLTYVQGAGHNVFNDQSRDEGNGPNRLTRENVHTISKATYLALLDTYLLGQSNWLPYLVNSWGYMRPPEIPVDFKISNEFKLAIGSTDRLVIDDFQTQPSIFLASSDSEIVYTVQNPTEGILQDTDSRFQYVATDAMNGMTRYIDQAEAPRGMGFDWNQETAHLNYLLSERIRDLSGFTALSFRAAQGSRHPNTIALNADLDFTVSLKDGNGNIAMLSSARYGKILTTYARDGGWANEFNTLRMPLAAFHEANPSLQLNNITEVSFLFGGDYGSRMGRLFIDDIEMVR